MLTSLTNIMSGRVFGLSGGILLTSTGLLSAMPTESASRTLFSSTFLHHLHLSSTPPCTHSLLGAPPHYTHITTAPAPAHFASAPSPLSIFLFTTSTGCFFFDFWNTLILLFRSQINSLPPLFSLHPSHRIKLSHVACIHIFTGAFFKWVFTSYLLTKHFSEWDSRQCPCSRPLETRVLSSFFSLMPVPQP